MNKKFHITIKDNEDGMVYMDDDVIGILGAVVVDQENTRAIIQMPSAMQDSLEVSRAFAELNVRGITAAKFAIEKMLENDFVTRVMFGLLDGKLNTTETVKIDFNAIKENFNK